MKILIGHYTFFLVTLILCCFPKSGFCAYQTPEDLVRDFYTWYIELSTASRNIPVYDKKIYDYVYPCTVNRCRKDHEKVARDSDYFTKSQDIWKELLDELVVYQAISINDSVSIVPVSINPKMNWNIIVFVKKEDDALYIIKVEDQYYIPDSWPVF